MSDPFTSLCEGEYPEDKLLWQRVDELSRIIIPEEGSDQDGFWRDGARDLLVAIMLHVATHPGFQGKRNLATVRTLIEVCDQELKTRLEDTGEENVYEDMLNNPPVREHALHFQHLMGTQKMWDSIKVTAKTCITQFTLKSGTYRK